MKFLVFKMLEWNPVNSKFHKSLWECCSSAEGGILKRTDLTILCQYCLILARLHQEPQQCTDEQHMNKTTFWRCKGRCWGKVLSFKIGLLQMHLFLLMCLFSRSTLKKPCGYNLPLELSSRKTKEKKDANICLKTHFR